MLFSCYAGGAEYVLNQEFELGIQIINKACERRNDARVYQRWITGYDKEMSFEEFKEKLIHDKREERWEEELTEKETFEKVKAILKMRR